MLRKPYMLCPRAKTLSTVIVGARREMKGKNKSRARDRDMWLDSDDEYVVKSSSFTEDVHPAMFSLGSSLGTPHVHRDFMKPRNVNQEKYVHYMESAAHPIVVAIGPAGCGKSMWACITGVRKLQSGAVSKLILTRPAVSVDEEHGFLPGTLEEKMDPWIRPLYDVLYKYYTPKQVQQLMEKQVIEICPLAYMRGRTFENSWIILDEAQNTLKQQMLMALTRIGRGSKFIVTGDPAQHDRGFENNGLTDLMYRMKHKPCDDIALMEFNDSDIERHPVIQKVLRLYKD